MLSTEQLYRKFQGPIKNFIRSKVKDAVACQDLQQDVFMKAHQKLPELRDASRAGQWIFQIARNVVRDFYRKKYAAPAIGRLPEIPEVPDGQEENGLLRCVLPKMQTLPGIYREAISAVELDGLSQKQYAEKLAISYTGAKSRVQRGRALLKAALEACCGISSDRYGQITDYEPPGACAC